MHSKGLPHMAIIDVNMADEAGINLCEDLRDIAALPIIALISAGAELQTRVSILHYVDDLVTLSETNERELATRTARILGRSGSFGYAGAAELAVMNGFSFDPIQRQVTLKGEARRLTLTENALLEVLLKHRGQIVEADTLIARVWGLRSAQDGMNSLRVHMHRLRQKIELDPDNPQIILTKRGTGYCFTNEQSLA